MSQVNQAIEAAVAHHRAGRLQEAESIYRQILQADPDQPDALHLLGVLAHQAGRQDDALALIRRAIEVNPSQAAFHCNLGLVYRARHELDRATAAFTRALEVDPNYADAHYNLGNAFHRQGRPDDAEACYRRAIRANPAHSLANNNLASVLINRGESGEAADCCRRALEIQPRFAEAHNNLGNALKRQNQVEEAAACYRRALDIRPDYAQALNNLAVTQRAQGQLEQAVSCYRRALEIEPQLLEACIGLAAVFDDWNRFQEAVACYRRALEIRPDDADLLDCLFEALKNEGQPDEAADKMRKALEIEPNNKRRFALATVLPVIYRSADEMAQYRRRLTDRLSQLIADGVRFDSARGVLPTLFYLTYQGMDDRPIQEMVSRLYTAEAASTGPPCKTARDGSGKIRVGFLSRHLRNHSVGKLTGGFIERMSRESFQVVVLSLRDHHERDARQIRDGADEYLVLPRSLELARQMVADAALDVLIYPDIGMDPVTSALARTRLAPIQCVTWGHPVTTGIPTIDYFLSSELIEPDGAEAHYSEQLVKFTSLPAFYHRPEISAERKSRADFGLDASRHLYLCPQNLFKLHPDFDRPLGEILRSDPAGDVVLIEGKAPRWRELLLERFRSAFPDVADRVKFVPRQDYDDFLQLIAIADVVLDPIHFGGGNTNYQALALGTPVVTWPSGFMRGRIAYGCYQKMGILDCVAASIDDYARIAVRLGTDRPYRRQIHREILAAAHTLFEDEQAVGELERFLLQAVEHGSADRVPRETAAAEQRATSPIPAALQAGIKRHQEGRLEDAEQVYRQVLQADPQQPDALHLLGLLAYQHGRYAQAVDSMNRAIRVNPDRAAFHCDLGIVHRAAGEFDQAEAAYGRALKINPGLVNAHYNLGNLLQQQGRPDEAAARYQKALMLQPDHAETHNGLGIVQRSRGKLEQAADHFRRAVQAKPCVGTLNNLGLTYHEMGKLDDAIHAYRQADQMEPARADVQNNFGNTLYAQEKIGEATVHYRRALELEPRNVAALSNLGNVLKRQGMAEESIGYLRRALEIDPDHAHALANLGGAYQVQQRLQQAATCYRRALEKNPKLVEAYNNLGTISYQRKDFTEAMACYRRALEIRPDYLDALDNLAVALKDGGQTGEATANLQKALEIKASPKRRFTLATVLPAIGRSVDELAHWRKRLVDQLTTMIEEGVRLDPVSDVVPTLFYLPYQGINDREIQQMVTRLYAKEENPPQPRRASGAARSGKIRIGFLSKYFRNHTIGKLSRGLIAQLSRRAFHVTVFSLGAHDNPDASEIQRQADRYVALPEDLAKARQMLIDAELDVLLYTDIGMDPLTSTLARTRLAPVQCVTWGHPVTTGIPTIDYFISSALLEPPGAEDHYTERLVRLDSLPVYFYRPQLSSPPKSRADFGLSDSTHIYLCPQSLFKFHPDFDRPMAEILRRDPLGQIVLIEGGFPQWRELLMDRFRSAMPDVVDSVRFVPHQKLDDFLHLVTLSDVVLDPLHFGGGSSTYETFSLGTPIVTLPSEFMRGRVTLACYRKMGLLDCVASTAEDYVQRAVRLGTDRAYRRQVRAKILAAAGTLFEDHQAVGQLERFLRSVVEDRQDDRHAEKETKRPHLDRAPQRNPGSVPGGS